MRILLACVLTWALGGGAALACDYPTPVPFEIQSDGDDSQPPGAPRVEIARVKRGREPQREGCGHVSSSCDDIGYVLLDVGAAAGEGDEALGYVLELSGDLPPQLEGYQRRPIAPSYEPGQLRLPWSDGVGETRYDFVIDVYAVDRAGNMSERATQVHVVSDGDDGCSASPARAGGGWFALSVALLLLRQRRRARASEHQGDSTGT